MMKRKKSIIAICIATIFGGITAVTSSLAWMYVAASTERSNNPIEGTVEDAYYASGTGTQGDPFIITRPRHLYNLAWLQFLGYYNKTNDHQYYFKLGNNIDMSTFGAIPPIGSEKNPFVGNFDGQGYVISGATISNEFSDFGSHPSVISAWDNADRKQPHILGLFGIIGDYTNGNKPSSYSSAVNEFVNTGVTGATIKSVVTNCLVGVAAGYVNDTNLTDSHNVLKNIIIDNSTLSLPNSATSAYDSTNLTNNISDYTLVGYTNNVSNVVKASKSMYGINVDTNISFSASEDGNSTGWGGSLNMLNMFDRITDMYTNYSTTQSTYAWKKNHVIVPGGEKNVNGQDTVTTADSSIDGSPKLFNRSNSNYYKAGNLFQFRGGSSNYYNYLIGGTYNVYNYQKYYHHSGHRITVDGEHYLTSTNLTNTGTVTSSSEDDAIVWTIPTTGSTGKIYTTYNYTDYYLTVNGTSVYLRTGSTNGTTWEIDRDASGHVRYSYNGYYLTYDSGWKMVALPSEPVEPEEPQAPTPVTQPNQAEYNARKITAPANANSTYQVSYTSNGTTYYMHCTYDDDASAETSLYLSGWTFSNLSNNSTTTISFKENNNTYYLYIYNGTLYAHTSGTSFTVSQSGSTYRFSYKNKGTTYYIRFSGSDFVSSTTNSNNYFTVERTSTAVSNYNSAIDTEYQNALAAYNQYLTDYQNWQTQHGNWQTQHDTWETNHANWVTTMNNLHPITVSTAEVDGPDIDNTYDRTEYGNEYKSSDTTFFPLNVVKDDEVNHTATTNSITNYYPKDTNTGYVTIGSSFSNSTTDLSTGNSSMRVSRYNASSSSNHNIKQSFYTGQTSLTNVKTINASGSVVNVNANDYEKYSDTKTAFESILTSSAALDGNTRYIYGLHFMSATISMDHILNADWVSIGGEEKTNYDLPANAIDFNLKETGYINFFAGSYFTNDVNSFFSLHKVVRTGNRITNIFEIEEVYKDTATTAKNHSYVYKIKDSSGNYYYTCPYSFDAEGNKTSLVEGKDPEATNLLYADLPAGYVSASSCVFKTSQIKVNSLTSYQNYAFYFEIPMNAGEYCLGSVPGGTGGYLMYLDIGANSAKTNRTITYEKFSLNEKTYSYPTGVSLNDLPSSPESGVATINIASVVDSSDSACMVIKATATGDFSIDRSGTDVALSRAQAANAPPIYASDNITLVHEVNSSTNIVPTPTSSVSYDINRMTYFDYMVNSDTLCVTTFTDYISGNEITRVIEQTKYKGNSVNGTVVSTYRYNPMLDTPIDERTSMKIYNTSNGVKYTVDQIINTTSLPIPTAKLPSTVILEIRLHQDGGDTYTDDTKLVMVVDTSISDTDVYYKYDNCTIVYTPDTGSITVLVTNYVDSFVVTVYNYGTQTSSTYTATTSITINGVVVTGNNQTIPEP